MRIYTCTPRPFFEAAHPDWYFFDRDMGLTCRELQKLGHDSKVVLLDGEGLKIHSDVIRATIQDMESVGWWKALDLDVLVLGAWALPEYTPIARAVKQAGVKLIVRCDSGGNYSQFGRPFLSVLRDNFWQVQSRYRNFVFRIAATVAKTLIGYSPWAREYKVATHLSYADLICIESPGAANSLRKMLIRDRRSEVAERVQYVAHPVGMANRSVITDKKNQIVCIGRWKMYQKNTSLLVSVLVEFLEKNPNYSAIVAGTGEEVLLDKLKALNCSKSVRKRFMAAGRVEHEQILDWFGESKICLISSRWESFHIAAAEALCLGCSVVGPKHVSSVRNLISKNSGMVSDLYTPKALGAALQAEMRAWDNGERSPALIAKDWRAEVSSEAVVCQMLNYLQRREEEVIGS
jgi:glycosyltransferase involved in cell wall biosynthesis